MAKKYKNKKIIFEGPRKNIDKTIHKTRSRSEARALATAYGKGVKASGKKVKRKKGHR